MEGKGNSQLPYTLMESTTIDFIDIVSAHMTFTVIIKILIILEFVIELFKKTLKTKKLQKLCYSPYQKSEITSYLPASRLMEFKV